MNAQKRSRQREKGLPPGRVAEVVADKVLEVMQERELTVTKLSKVTTKAFYYWARRLKDRDIPLNFNDIEMVCDVLALDPERFISSIFNPGQEQHLFTAADIERIVDKRLANFAVRLQENSSPSSALAATIDYGVGRIAEELTEEEARAVSEYRLAALLRDGTPLKIRGQDTEE